MPKHPRAIVVVSDLHVGDMLALWPEDDDEVGHYRVIREWIRAQWEEFCGEWIKSVLGDSPFLLVVNGDAMQGNNSKFGTLMTKSMAVQVRAASTMLRPLASRAVGTMLVEGTEVHTFDDEEEVARALGNFMHEVKLIRPATGYVHQFARVQMNGLNHIFRHHTSVAGRSWTEAGAQGNHLVDDRVRRLRSGHTPADVLVLAHRHVYGHTSTMDGASVVTPSWQGVSRWARAKTREDIPAVGACVLDYRNCIWKEHPHVRSFVRFFPEPQAISVQAEGSEGVRSVRDARKARRG